MKNSYKSAFISSAILTAGFGLILFFFPEVPFSLIAAFFVLFLLVLTVHHQTMRKALAGREEKPLKAVSIEDSLISYSPQGIFIIDSGGLIIDLNLKAESWFFDGREKICGNSLFRNVDCSLKGNRRFKTIFFNDMGTHFPAEVHVRRLDKEREVYYAVFIEDLTENVREQDKLIRMASEDPLTGLLNRRSFLVELKKEIDRSSRTGLNCSIALIDLDHFKKINDSYGHDFGDEVLRVFSGILKENCRSLDIICRYGGEEFVVLLPHTNPESSLHYLQRVRRDFASHPYSHNIQPTFSCGVTGGKLIKETGDVDSLLKEADKLLYKAKDKGRDRIESNVSIREKNIRVVS